VYVKKASLQQAMQEFTQALKYDEKNLDAHWELGKIYESLGDKDAAYKEFKKILLIDANYKLKESIKKKLLLFREQGVKDDEWQNF
jgi:tetratricopeptide (TPR) repeat protein